MQKRHMVSLLIAVLVSLVVATNVQAWTLMPDVWPSASTSYKLDGTYTSLGTNWTDRANEAAAHWGANTLFSFTSDPNSPSRVQAGNLTCTATQKTLANMAPAPTAQGIYRASFVITVNASCNLITWHTGTTSPPMGTSDLRTVLRHEFGHAAGLDHVLGSSAQLMYATISPGTLKSIATDDINGIAYLYNMSSTLRQTAAASYWYWLGQFTYDNTHGGVGYKGPGWDHVPNCCPLAHNGAMAWSPQTGASSWFAFNGSRITWKLTRHNNRGPVGVYIDSTYVWSTNMNDSNNTLWQLQKTWEVTPGQHIIEVRGAGGGTLYTDTDAFITDVYGNTGNHDDANTTAIGYLGNWTHSTCCPTASGGTISWSNTKNDAAAILFYGTGIRYIHTKAYNRGKVKVTIDATGIPNMSIEGMRE